MIDQIIMEGVSGASLLLDPNVYPLTLFDPQYETRNDETVIVQSDGIWPTYDYLGKVTIHMEGEVLGSSGSDYWQKRMALASVFVPQPQFGYRYVVNLRVQFTGFSEEVSMHCQLDGRPDLPIAADFPSMSQFQIALKGADPRFYGAAQTATTGAPIGGGGLTFPFSFPLAFTTLSTPPIQGDLYLQNSGNAATAPVAVISGPCSSPVLTAIDPFGNVTQFALYGLTLATGDTATIDFGQRTVLASNGSSLFGFSSGTWWQIPPNALVHVEFRCLDSDSDTSCSITWANAYLL